MAVFPVSRIVSIAPSEDGIRYGRYAAGDYIYGQYAVYPKRQEGIFDNDTIPNLAARWRVIQADEPARWQFYDGGGYSFDAEGLSPGVYTAVYEVRDYDGWGQHAQASISVTVTA